VLSALLVLSCGAKDRVTILPDLLRKPLEEHLYKVRVVHEKDLADGCGRVPLPDALDRKYPNVSREWRWQWVFPQERRWVNPKTGEQGRHHVDESILQKAFKQAVEKARLTKRATCHTLGHSFATHLIETGYDVRSVQELLGHKDVRTTMVYTHVIFSRCGGRARNGNGRGRRRCRWVAAAGSAQAVRAR
jgi:integrase